MRWCHHPIYGAVDPRYQCLKASIGLVVWFLTGDREQQQQRQQKRQRQRQRRRRRRAQQLYAGAPLLLRAGTHLLSFLSKKKDKHDAFIARKTKTNKVSSVKKKAGSLLLARAFINAKKKNSGVLFQRQDKAGSGCSPMTVDLMADGLLAVEEEEEEGGQDGKHTETKWRLPSPSQIKNK